MSHSSFQVNMRNGPSTTASTSAHPHQAISASYHPLPRPKPLPPLEPVDTQAVKQELHDALGENGLPYWKAMNGYLLGQVGKGELEGMVRSWLPKDRLYLHNKLLFSILTNASATRQPPLSASLAAQKKRKRVAPDHPDFDTDEYTIESKARVSHWHTSLSIKDRNRLKRLMAGRASNANAAVNSTGQAGANGANGTAEGGKEKDKEKDKDKENGKAVSASAGETSGDGADSGDWIAQQRQSSAFTPRTFLAPPLSTDRSLPSAPQLAQRLTSLAPAYGLSVSPEAAAEIGEFLAVGMDAHLVDILHGVVNLTGTDRPSGDGIYLSAGSASGLSAVDEGVEGLEEARGEVKERKQSGVMAGLVEVINGHSAPGQVKKWGERDVANGGSQHVGSVNGKRKWGESNGQAAAVEMSQHGSAEQAAEKIQADGGNGGDEDVDMEAGSGEAVPLKEKEKEKEKEKGTDGPVKPLFKSPEAIKAVLGRRDTSPTVNGSTTYSGSSRAASTSPLKGRGHLHPPPPPPPPRSLFDPPSQPPKKGSMDEPSDSPSKRRRSSRLHTSSSPTKIASASAPPSASTLPTPTLDTLQHLFALAPGLHAQASPALYKLAARQYQAESAGKRSTGVVTDTKNYAGVGLDFESDGQQVVSGTAGEQGRVVLNGTRRSGRRHSTLNGTTSTGIAPKATATATATATSARQANGVDSSNANANVPPVQAATDDLVARRRQYHDHPSVASVVRSAAHNRTEQVTRIMLESGLLAPEKQQDEGKKRHSHHWKYEDPALMLRDVLG